MSKKIIIFLVVILIILILSVLRLTKIPKTSDSPSISSVPSSVPSLPAESTLSISPDSITADLGGSYDVDVQIHSQGKYPTLLQLELAYDPSALTNVSLSPGSIIPDPDVLLDNIDETTGRLSYALSLKPGQKPLYFSGIVAKLKFEVKKTTPQKQTTIYFQPKTAIRSVNENIPLKVAYGIKIFINHPQTASASPTFR